MIWLRYTVPAAAALVASACVAPPQQPVPAEGLRVRVTVSCPAARACTSSPNGGTYEGSLILVDSDTLILYAKNRRARVTLSVFSISKLEVYRGRKGSAAAAAKGAVVGAFGGAVIGALLGGTTEAILGGLDGDREVAEKAAEGAGVGAVIGGIGGAVAGATSGEVVWEEVTVEQLRQELCHCRVPLTEVATQAAAS